MLKLILSPQAREDLFDIWFYIAEDSTINADRFIDKLAKKYHWFGFYTGQEILKMYSIRNDYPVIWSRLRGYDEYLRVFQ